MTRTWGIDSLPLDAFHQEEDGTFLYLLEEGAGLLGSTQLRRVPADILSTEGDRAFTTGLEQGGSYVVYASRPLEDEEWAVETAAQRPSPGHILTLGPGGNRIGRPLRFRRGRQPCTCCPRRRAPSPS